MESKSAEGELDDFGRLRVRAVRALGFSAGLPYALNSSTLSAWLAEAGVGLGAIGLFSLAHLPYSLKVLWAPFLDRYRAPGVWGLRSLGRRRGWIFLFQGSVVLCLVAMAASGGAGPGRVSGLAVLAFLLGLLAASQDVVVDAHRSDTLLPGERARGTAAYVLGYRAAMVVSGAGALVLADRLSFPWVYLLMALICAGACWMTLRAPEPDLSHGEEGRPRSLRDAVVDPLRDFFRRKGAVRCLLFLTGYRLPELASLTVLTPFLLSLGYTRTEIGLGQKGAGLLATIVGALLGGRLVGRLGIARSLLWFGLLETAGNLGYLLLSLCSSPGPHRGAPSVPLLLLAVGVDNLCAGLAIAACGAYQLSLCSTRYSATQFALITSAAGLGGKLVGASAGFVAARLGFSGFFLLTVPIGLPALLLLPGLRRSGLSRAPVSP